MRSHGNGTIRNRAPGLAPVRREENIDGIDGTPAIAFNRCRDAKAIPERISIPALGGDEAQRRLIIRVGFYAVLGSGGINGRYDYGIGWFRLASGKHSDPEE